MINAERQWKLVSTKRFSLFMVQTETRGPGRCLKLFEGISEQRIRIRSVSLVYSQKCLPMCQRQETGSQTVQLLWH